MLVNKTKKGYTSNRKYIHGRGFVDSVKNIGSYMLQNKDLITKPLLGAVGDLAAFGLSQGSKALLTKLMNKTKNIDEKGAEIIRNNVSNIIGSGIKKLKI